MRSTSTSRSHVILRPSKYFFLKNNDAAINMKAKPRLPLKWLSMAMAADARDPSTVSDEDCTVHINL